MRLSNEAKKFIEENYKGTLVPDLVEMLNKKFNAQYNCKQVKKYKIKHGLKSGIKTQFTKGQAAHNHRKVGDEFVSKYDGYAYIKVAEPNVWVKKQRYLWEKENNIKISRGQSIVFLDQDKTNFSLDNLMCLDDRDKLVMKNKKLFSNDKELTKVGVLIAKLNNRCYDIQKEG